VKSQPVSRERVKPMADTKTRKRRVASYIGAGVVDPKPTPEPDPDPEGGGDGAD
jgi:hypothetical protein